MRVYEQARGTIVIQYLNFGPGPGRGSLARKVSPPPILGPILVPYLLKQWKIGLIWAQNPPDTERILNHHHDHVILVDRNDDWQLMRARA